MKTGEGGPLCGEEGLCEEGRGEKLEEVSTINFLVADYHPIGRVWGALARWFLVLGRASRVEKQTGRSLSDPTTMTRTRRTKKGGREEKETTQRKKEKVCR